MTKSKTNKFDAFTTEQLFRVMNFARREEIPLENLWAEMRITEEQRKRMNYVNDLIKAIIEEITFRNNPEEFGQYLDALYEEIDELEMALDQDRFEDGDEEAMIERLHILNEEADELCDRLIKNERRAA
ncbi:hypothetical protein [Sulfitobacter sp. 1A13679]|uniref:hypothetical protein n=1 Tax=Sulfitobacter sp. 1A13679 TaxID=3368597 RepID=UPI003746EFE9